MKHIFFLLFTLLSISASSQNTQNQEPLDTLQQEREELVQTVVEQVVLQAVDSIMEEGMYMKALEILDSLQANRKRKTGTEPSPQMYLRKGQIYMQMEEWQQLIAVTNECIKYHNETMPDEMAAVMYSMQGMGYKYLEDYKNAIRSYESAVGFYSIIEEYGSVGDMLCSIAYCYDKSGKPSTASSFYEKGLMKFLQYFNITKKQLIQSNLKVDESYKESILRVFAAHLLIMAIHEQDNGDKLASKEYLLMSAHCGNSTARSEYQRIYGRY